VQELCAGVDLLIHDAQYTPAEFAAKSTWGHCTVEYAVWLAAQVGARRLALFHHDPDRDDELLDRLAEDARVCGMSMGVDVFAAAEGLSVTV
jgi:ribonuclease BN (tRNA processing enzyme)